MKASKLIQLLEAIIEKEGDLHLQLNGKLIYFDPYADTLWSGDVDVPVIELGDTYEN